MQSPLTFWVWEKSGWEILQEIKSDPRTAGIPVVIVSVVDEPNLGIALHAADYLIKPVTKPRVLQALRRHVPPQGQRGRTVLVVDSSVPSHEGLRRNDRGDFAKQAPPEHLRLCRQPPALIVVQAEAFGSQLLAQHLVFFAETLAGIALLLATSGRFELRA